MAKVRFSNAQPSLATNLFETDSNTEDKTFESKQIRSKTKQPVRANYTGKREKTVKLPQLDGVPKKTKSGKKGNKRASVDMQEHQRK